MHEINVKMFARHHHPVWMHFAEFIYSSPPLSFNFTVPAGAEPRDRILYFTRLGENLFYSCFRIEDLLYPPVANSCMLTCIAGARSILSRVLPMHPRKRECAGEKKIYPAVTRARQKGGELRPGSPRRALFHDGFIINARIYRYLSRQTRPGRPDSRDDINDIAPIILTYLFVKQRNALRCAIVYKVRQRIRRKCRYRRYFRLGEPPPPLLRCTNI